jgi:hypothetical protein
MIKLSPLIKETIVGNPLVGKITLREMLYGNYSEAFALWRNDIRLYRAHRLKPGSSGMIEVFPSRGERKSLDSSNVYTNLLSSLPSWKDYPPRSFSLIFGSNEDTVDLYPGATFYVFPKNGARIVVSPVKDVLSARAFPHLEKNTDLNITNFIYMPAVMEALIGNYEYISDINLSHHDKDHWVFGLAHSNYQKFIDLLQELSTKERLAQIMQDLRKTSSNVTFYIDKILSAYMKHGGTWEQFFDDNLDPQKNGYALVGLNEMSKYTDDEHECWTNSDCLLVHKSKEQDLIYISKSNNNV